MSPSKGRSKIIQPTKTPLPLRAQARAQARQARSQAAALGIIRSTAGGPSGVPVTSGTLVAESFAAWLREAAEFGTDELVAHVVGLHQEMEEAEARVTLAVHALIDQVEDLTPADIEVHMADFRSELRLYATAVREHAIDVTVGVGIAKYLGLVQELTDGEA